MPVRVIPSGENKANRDKTEEEKKESAFQDAILQGLLEAFEAEEKKSAAPAFKQVQGPVTVGKALSEEHKRRMIAHA